MSVEKTNKACELNGTDFCNYIGSEGCQTCYLNKSDGKSDHIKIKESWDATLDLIPDNIDEVHTSKECWLCRGEHKNVAERYALAELANKEPIYKKGYFWGLGPKVAMKIGSLLTIPVPCCKKCEKNIKTCIRMRWGIGVIGVILGLAVLIVLLSIAQSAQIWIGIPYIAAVIVAAAGIITGSVTANAYKRKKQAETAMNLFETPILSEMKEKGWFAMQEDNGTPRMRFSNKKPRPNMRLKSRKTIDTAVDEVLK